MICKTYYFFELLINLLMSIAFVTFVVNKN